MNMFTFQLVNFLTDYFLQITLLKVSELRAEELFIACGLLVRDAGMHHQDYTTSQSRTP
jgi:hypothetical protein